MIGNATAQSIYPFILIPDKIFQNLKSKSPNPNYISVLIHEETHRRRQKEIGALNFFLKYIFDSKFRLEEELIATKAAMEYLKSKGINYDFEKNAKFLSGHIYGRMISQKKAEGKLREIWEEI